MTIHEIADFEVSWKCQDYGHLNAMIVTISEQTLQNDESDDMSIYDDILSVIYDDMKEMKEDLCEVCGSCGSDQAIWKMVDKRQTDEIVQVNKRRRRF